MENLDPHAPEAPAPRVSVPSRSVPPWLKGILVVLGVTFLLGFYLPLLLSHQKLTDQFKALSGEYQNATQAFEQASTALRSTEAEKKTAKGQLKEISLAKTSAERDLNDLYEEVRELLAVPLERKQFTLKRGPRSVIVVVDALHLIYPHKTFVHDPGAELLCNVARAIPKNAAFPTQIIAHQNGATPYSGLLAKQYASSWQLSAVLAAEVAAAMSNCGVAGADLRAVGAAHFEGNARDSRKSLARFEIHLYPAP